MHSLFCIVGLHMLSLCLANPTIEDTTVTCSTQGTVMEGSTADITCDFHEQFSRDKEGFYIYRSSPNEEVIMAICEWVNRVARCSYVEDCSVKGSSGDGKVTFTLPVAHQNHTGEYFCKTVPFDKAPSKQCSLNVTKKESPSNKEPSYANPPRASCQTNSPVLRGEGATIMCVFSPSIGRSGVHLKKYTPEKHDFEEIVRCNPAGGCTTNIADLQVHMTDTFFRVSIHPPSSEVGGIYFFGSGSDVKVSKVFSIETTSRREFQRSVPLDNIVIPLYGISACLFLVVILSVIALVQRSGCCTRKEENDTECSSEGTQESQEPLFSKDINVYLKA